MFDSCWENSEFLFPSMSVSLLNNTSFSYSELCGKIAFSVLSLISSERQGDLLLPSVLLSISIRNNDQIKGIPVESNGIKLVIFDDDMTSFARDKSSNHVVFNTPELFSTFSGLITKSRQNIQSFSFSEMSMLVAQNTV